MGIFREAPKKDQARAVARPTEPRKVPVPSTTEHREVATAGCLFGPKTLVKGEISGDEDLVIRGRVEGTISIDKNLIVDAGGCVRASVRAAAVVISGEVVGDCHARERVELRPSGRLTGDIHAPRIVIAEGAEFHGRSHMAAAGTDRETGATQKAG